MVRIFKAKFWKDHGLSVEVERGLRWMAGKRVQYA